MVGFLRSHDSTRFPELERAGTLTIIRAWIVSIRYGQNKVSLRDSETLSWESKAQRWKVRTSQGYGYWNIGSHGTLIVTDERIIYSYIINTGISSIWQRPISKLIKVTKEANSWGVTVIVLWFEDLQKPVGFVVDATQLEISMNSQSYEITLQAVDLIELLKILKQ